MSDKFTCLSLERLLTWIKTGEKAEKIFGIPKSLFFTPSPTDCFRINRYTQVLETPVGVAAGPHTQLSQNIVCAWLAGARYIELKTIQVLDELEVTKPCINMEDEGYNCEWSQELKLSQSLDEYVNALVAIHILKKRLGHEGPVTQGRTDPGFLFNMSVGYNLEGILSPGVQAFLDTMADAGDLIEKKLAIAEAVFPEARDLEIPARVSDNITISTMHGCPPDEIEKIGSYFIEKRKLNTTIKLNPTLLGPEKLRYLLNEKLGFDTIVPDIAFEHDLKFDSGVILIENLLKKAGKTGVEFNIKLTNTLETQNRGRLPEKESMVYLSGRPLHVISTCLAFELQKKFDGLLDISFSAGADCFNIPELLSCGLKPVTVCSDILKPGGYTRIAQYLENISTAFESANALSVSDFIRQRAKKDGSENELILHNLKQYAEKVEEKAEYHKKSFPWSSIKTSRKLTAFDCIHAPCSETCPAGQEVASYMYYTAKGMFDKALEVILRTNPFPSVQGMACDHPCTSKCTRINYDTPLRIREIKRFIAENSAWSRDVNPLSDNHLTAAVIGGGVSGFSAAYFLKINGFGVDLFEARPFAGGMAADAIPRFRLDDKSIERDIDRIIDLGVKVKYGQRVDKKMFNFLKNTYDYIYIAVGASCAIRLDVPGADAQGVYDQLEFLSGLRRGKPVRTGKNIVVIGGGNSAMDASRAAKRLAGENGRVTILYRRSIGQMPADPEEIKDAVKEGIVIETLAAPESVISENGRVCAIQCHRMGQGEPDAGGRPRPVILKDSLFQIPADTIISAIGQKVVVPFFPEPEFLVDNATGRTSIDRVYAGGDALRGASTLIRAIADGQRAVQNICRDAALSGTSFSDTRGCETDIRVIEEKKAFKVKGCRIEELDGAKRSGFDLVTKTLTRKTAMEEASRCLSCDTLCNVCVSVCPNRANFSYPVRPFQETVYKAVCKNSKVLVKENGIFAVLQAYQVVNIADFCNECGNCATFCPTMGAPYIDKPRFYLSHESFQKEPDGYLISGNVIFKRQAGRQVSLIQLLDGYMYENQWVTALFGKSDFKVSKVSFKSPEEREVDLTEALQMKFLYISLKQDLGI
jgi:putative selenate reductase